MNQFILELEAYSKILANLQSLPSQTEDVVKAIHHLETVVSRLILSITVNQPQGQVK